ncbi:MAG TPA: hypothetical protein PLO23_01995 [Alphaproteobacteria bacterium]|nr:hypothetical protein [Alphaproteobacteria bacterium]
MTDITLIESLLAADIKATQRRIKRLMRDPATLAFWDLGKKRGPKITMGADIECLLEYYDRETAQFFGLMNPEIPASLFIKVLGDFDQKLHKLCEREPEFDGGLYELNPRPGKPQTMIRRYRALKKHFEAVAEQYGLRHRMGQGHWHLSFQSPEDGRFFNIEHPFLFHLACRQILDQIAAPALFIKPRQAEYGTNNGARHLGLSWQSSGSICARRDKYPNGARHYELRLAHMAPYLPVLLILSAIERTLKSRPADLNNPPVPTLQAGALVSEYFTIEPEHKIRVEGGPYSYHELFRTMEKSDFLDEHLPRLAKPLKAALLRNYRDFLKAQSPLRNPAYSVASKSSFLTEITDKIEELEGAPPGFALAALEKT